MLNAERLMQNAIKNQFFCVRPDAFSFQRLPLSL